MASIAGVSWGTPCDHIIRRAVTLLFDEATDRYYCFTPAGIDPADPSFALFVNEEAFAIEGGEVYYAMGSKWVIFTAIGGFGMGGFGYGGFGSLVNIAQLGQFPVDEVELQFRTTVQYCPKCDLKDDDGRPLDPKTQMSYGSGA